jgi:arabinan endo-1,5-alpha-L-arabinosidase
MIDVAARLRRFVAACALCLLWAPSLAQAQQRAAEPTLNERLAGDIRGVHDPAIIREGGTYYLFATGHVGTAQGIIPWRTSPDLVTWTYRGAVFPELPAWATERIRGTRGLWAPDISFTGSEYRLYYSVSTFGKNRSAIGLATSRTLDPAKPGYGWTDKGLVFESRSSDGFNAIDPNIFVDKDGRHWMTFGSFWSGIKVVELDPATGKPPRGRVEVHGLASRPPPGAVEAPFLIERDGFYYLFVSFEFCCRGANSTYYTVVGRAKNVLGPYLDQAGRPMLKGGGFLVLHADLDRTRRWRGPGHVAILREPGRDYIVYHAYDSHNSGISTLRIQPLGWTDDGWPVAL